MVNLRSIFERISFPIFISLIFLFLYIPIVILIVFSFNSVSFPAPWKEFSFKWYYKLFESIEIWRAFYVSIVVALSSTILSIFMAVGIIYYQMMRARNERLLNVFYGNVIIPEIILAVGLLGFFSYLSIPLGMITLIVAHTSLGLGFVVPIIYTRYDGLDKTLIESSLDLGATKTQTFFKIILPLLVPALIASGLLVFIISFDDFVLSFFCASSDSQTLSLYIYSMIRTGVSPIVNAASSLLLFFSSLLVMVLCSLGTKTKIF